MPQLIVHKINQIHLTARFKSYKYQPAATRNSPRQRIHCTFSYDTLSKLEDDGPLFLAKNVFSDKATFHPSEHVNWHDIRMWGSNNLHEVTEG